MTFREIEWEAQGLIEIHIPNKGWRFEWDNAKARMGCCNYTYKVISLSRHLVRLASDKEIINTILHEIAHALAPDDHHGPMWKRVARSIGCTGDRCHTVDTSALANWIGTCGCEGRRHPRNKRPLRGRTYTCRHCRRTVTYKPR